MNKNNKVKVEDITLKEIKIDLNHKNLKLSENEKKKINDMLDCEEYKLSFILKNCDVSVANAIRRITLMELEILALDFEVETIETNDKELITEDVKDRICLIKLNQNISPDSVFSLNFENLKINKDKMIVRSGDLMQIEGKKDKKMFSSNSRLLKLMPGGRIYIPRIRVSKNIGNFHPKYSITGSFEYECRDYIPVSFISSKGNIENFTVKTQDVIDIMKKRKINHSLVNNIDNTELFKNRILFVPDNNYLKLASEQTLKSMKTYQAIIEEEPIQIQSSLDSSPREFYLSFKFYGNIDPINAMKMVCQNIINRLEKISDPSKLNVESDESITKISLTGEKYTVGELITKKIYELDPSIGLINYTLIHHEINVISVNIKHPESLKIYSDAVKELIVTFQDIHDQFDHHK